MVIPKEDANGIHYRAKRPSHYLGILVFETNGLSISKFNVICMIDFLTRRSDVSHRMTIFHAYSLTLSDWIELVFS